MCRDALDPLDESRALESAAFLLRSRGEVEVAERLMDATPSLAGGDDDVLFEESLRAFVVAKTVDPATALRF